MADAPVKPANPAPLGLVAFGLTTVVLSSINAGLLSRDALPAVVPLAFAFGGFAQIVAGIVRRRDERHLRAGGRSAGRPDAEIAGAAWGRLESRSPLE